MPIEVGSIDPLFDDEPGYRISPDEFALPDIRLAGDEAAVVGLATRVWEHARLAEATTVAVRSAEVETLAARMLTLFSATTLLMSERSPVRS